MKALGIVCGLLGPCLSSPVVAQNDADLSAGGLAPPEAIESESDRAAREQQTEAELQKAEEQDSGRGLEYFWLNAEIGGLHLGPQTFTEDNLAEADLLDPQTGLAYGGGLGLRLVFLTFGARFRMASLPDWRLWTLNAEAGLRIPLGSLEPYFTLGGGYVSMSALDRDELDVSGFGIRGGAGLDFYLTEVFSLGGNLSGDVLFLSRSELGGAAAGTVYAESGSSIGAAGSLTLVAGLHF
jgi:hypothetical protein